ncbi:asparagine synthase-related protein [Pseudomonadota bacterium]
MGGICGIFNFDWSPVAQSMLAAMGAASSFRGPDGIHYRLADNAGLAHQAFHSTPESVLESQPSSYNEGRYSLAADARIDNRDELLPQLFPHLSRLEFTNIPDTDIIFAAYSKWGDNCAKNLIGDFAFVIWDRIKQQVFAARDTMGMRPLFYFIHDKRLLIASSINSVLQAIESTPTLNLPWIEEFVSRNQFRWIRETVYQGVYRLPPAYQLTATANGISTVSYHTFGCSSPPSYSKDEDWIAAFRELFNKVIAAQLRSTTPVAIHLSGGLDSASIACTAHQLSEAMPVPAINLASLCYRNTPSADEYDLIQLVRNHCSSFGALTTYADDLWAFKDFDLASGFPLEEPDIYGLRKHTMALFSMAANHGCRVALNGDMANLILGDGVYGFPPALKSLPYYRKLTEIRYFKARTRKSYVGVIARAYSPRGLTDAYHRLSAPNRNRRDSQLPWLRRPGDPRPFGHIPSIPREVQYSPDLSPVAMAALRLAMTPYNFTRLAFHSGLASFCGMEWRIPYVDRRIIDFGLHLPTHLACSAGMGRMVLRRSMRGTVPEPVLAQLRGGNTSGLYARGFAREQDMIDGLLQNSILDEMGIVDAEVLRQRLGHRQRSNKPLNRELFQDASCLYMENWLRRRKWNL